MIRSITDTSEIIKLDPLAKLFSNESEVVKYDIKNVVETWTWIIQSGSGVIFFYEIDGQLCGSLGAIKHKDITNGIVTATEAFWFVHPDKRGIGKELLTAFEDWAKANGCKRILMIALSDCMPELVENIYKKSGFKKIETTYMKEF